MQRKPATVGRRGVAASENVSEPKARCMSTRKPNQPRTKVLEDIADIVDVESFTREDRAELETFWAQQSAKVQAYVAGFKAMIEEMGETPGTASTNLSQAIVEMFDDEALAEIILGIEWTPRKSLASSRGSDRSDAPGHRRQGSLT